MRSAFHRTAPALAGAVLVVLAVASPGALSRADAGHESHGLRYVDTVRASSGEALPAVRSTIGAASTWCGTPTQTDLVPNTIAGHPVHWLYAVPSDGADQFATFATRMQTDAEEIDAWWRGQDPLRVPRNDLAQLPCGQQLDLTTVRFSLAAGQLTNIDTRFGAIFNQVGSRFGSQFTKYLVYYDGPVTDDDICGQAASDGDGIGVAIVYVQACVGVSTAAVAAHEFLHTLGTVPDEAPNNCGPQNDGHTCDSQADLMYPFIDDSPLAAKVLDVNRDDYYGHAAGFRDSQDSPWLVQVDRQQPFTVSQSGGAGTITSDLPGLLCTQQSCTTTWNAGTRLTLRATPPAGLKLARWTGACSGQAACSLVVGPGATASAVFAPLVYRLTVSVGGRGIVRSSRAGITCRPRCSASFPSFVPLRLTAVPAKGWRLRSWTGACRGRSLVCTVPMTAATSARAVFVRA